ncbi:unnamed protein product [Ectocarpus sp. 12 AP-2014]
MGKDVVPQLRFPQFDGKWNKTKLGDIASFSKGKNVSKDDVSDEGVNECIRYGELYTTYNETISEVFSKTNLSIDESVISEANDVIIPASGETQLDIATASCVLRGGIILGGDLNIIKTKNSGVFLSYYLNNKGKIDIARLSQGSSVIHLYARQLSTLKINFPSLPEQQKIAAFLTAVDDKITQLTKKKALLEQYKKGAMQQLFSQEIRFKPALSVAEGDDNGQDYADWEIKELGKVLKIGSGRDYKHLSEGAIPVFGSGGVMTKVNEFLYDGESVGIGRKGTIDKPVFLTGKFWTVDTLFYTHSFRGVLPKFIFYVFNTINWYSFNEASGVPSLSKRTIDKIEVNIPCMEEQTKIANFQSALDAKIAQVDHQIEKTTAFKKGVLQRMFV